MGLTVKLISSGSCIQIADCTAACITPTHTGLAEEHSNNLLNLPQRQQIAVHHQIKTRYAPYPTCLIIIDCTKWAREGEQEV